MIATLAELFRLDNRVAFVSGAAGHLGRAMTEALIDAGATVIANGRDAKKLAALADDLHHAGNRIRVAEFDVGDAAMVRKFFADTPRLDVLVNNAIDMAVRPFRSLEPGDFQTTYQSSVVAAFEATRAALPALRQAVVETGDATIINVASMYGVVSPDRRIYEDPTQASPLHYGPAKAALLQLTRHLAAELGGERIRVNALVPGPFPRPEIQTRDPAFARRLADHTMFGRLGSAAEIAGPLLFLASKASSYMTGASLVIDGGWTAW